MSNKGLLWEKMRFKRSYELHLALMFETSRVNGRPCSKGTPCLIRTPPDGPLSHDYIYIQGILLTCLSNATYNHSYTHSHTDGGVNHARRQPARQELTGADKNHQL